VPTSRETFVTFVDMLAAAMDEPRVDGLELAKRMHLSRSHLDRILSAAAGEPPARLRRRILLERAAYRLATTDHGVLEVAIEAGYSSNEAFTRAFERAFGAVPSVWRRSPGPVRLDTPNGVHFHPPGGLLLPALSQGTPMDLITTMTEHHLHLVAQMIDAAAQLSDDQLDAPIVLSVEGIDDEPTVRSLLSRLVGQLHMWNCSVANQPYEFDVESHESLESMRSRLSEHGPRFLDQLRQVIGNGRIEETFVDATCQPPRVFTQGAMIAHVLTYAAHRRTLVTGALASAGIDLEDDPLQWEPLEA
jgi:AraC family transcriptional regulator